MFSALLWSASHPHHHERLPFLFSHGSSSSPSRAVDYSSPINPTFPLFSNAVEQQQQQHEEEEDEEEQPTQQQDNLRRRRNRSPDPDAEVIALSPATLMTTHRFICEVCNKGFQRDQNLQLHRRGHNLPWKLNKQDKMSKGRKKVYVCPEPSCPHHHPSRALGDLTGIKKHFCRKHCDKTHKCERCHRMYAVESDCKAHLKTCGTKNYLCDCGMHFNRKDGYMAHRAFCVALAQENARVSANRALLARAGDRRSNKQHKVAELHPPSPPSPSLFTLGNELYHQQMMTTTDPLLPSSSLFTLNDGSRQKRQQQSPDDNGLILIPEQHVKTEPITIPLAEPPTADPFPAPPAIYYKKNLLMNPPPPSLYENESLLHDHHDQNLQLSDTAWLHKAAVVGAQPAGEMNTTMNSSFDHFPTRDFLGLSMAFGGGIGNNNNNNSFNDNVANVVSGADHVILGLDGGGSMNFDLMPFPSGGGGIAQFPAAAPVLDANGSAATLFADPDYQQQLLQPSDHQSIGFDSAAGPYSSSFPSDWRTWMK